MPELPHPVHEHFAQAVAAGAKPATAYRAAYGVINPEAAASLARTKAISARIAELRPSYEGPRRARA